MKQTELIMGMPITVALDDSAADTGLISEILAYFRQIDETFSTYKPDSVVSRLDRGELELAECSAEVQAVFEGCEAAKQRTRGYFDINHHGHLDPSGYVKGYAIEQAAHLVGSRSVTNFFIEAGGDAQISGHGEDGRPWRVGIKHPHEPGSFAKVLRLTNCAIATSGIYERGHHIYNPHTGLAVHDLVSLSVIGPSILEADVLATAAFAMGPEAGLRFLVTAGLEAYAITKTGQTLSTAGFSRYEAKN